jgi:hypothetical protein
MSEETALPGTLCEQNFFNFRKSNNPFSGLCVHATLQVLRGPIKAPRWFRSASTTLLRHSMHTNTLADSAPTLWSSIITLSNSRQTGAWSERRARPERERRGGTELARVRVPCPRRSVGRPRPPPRRAVAITSERGRGGPFRRRERRSGRTCRSTSWRRRVALVRRMPPNRRFYGGWGAPGSRTPARLSLTYEQTPIGPSRRVA